MRTALKTIDSSLERAMNHVERHFEVYTVLTWMIVLALAILPLCRLP